MPSKIKVYRHGVSGGIAGRNIQPPPRAECAGWSLNSSRSNTRFLQSVREDELSGYGVAFSLTVRECPDSAAEWKAAREALVARMRRKGCIRGHWLTEMQARRVPHMHGIAYFPASAVGPGFTDKPSEYLSLVVVSDWLAIAAKWGAGPTGQHAKPVTDAIGWARYLAKHAARGAQHYQRTRESLPAGWHSKTGRMWGHYGDWPLQEPVGVNLDQGGWVRFRRLWRAYRVSQARLLPSNSMPRAVKSARRCLTCHERRAAPYIGLSGWVPESVTLAMIAYLHATGAVVESC